MLRDMDLDAFVAAHLPTWQRLDRLRRRTPAVGAAADELVDLYQEVATHLSVVRTQAPDPALIAYLSTLLSGARLRASGTRTSGAGALRGFLVERLPAALYVTRRWWMAVMLVTLGLTSLMTWWLLANPQVEQTLLDPATIDQLVYSDFESYYTESAAQEFAAQVWINNAWVAARAIAFGVFGPLVLLALVPTFANLAVIASLMIRNDRADVFFGLILPHGMLELTAIFVAAGVGMRLFWSWVRPGPLPRLTALAQAGRAAGTIVLGLVLILLVSGAIEGFVTPSPLPTWARITIGAVAEIAFLAYVWGPGRAAVRRGITGDLAADRLEAPVATAG